MSALPELERSIAQFRFIPMVEWHAERPHSIMKRAMMGKRGYGKSASLALRIPEIRAAYRDPEQRKVLIDGMKLHNQPFDILAELGLDSHPTILACAHAGARAVIGGRGMHKGDIRKQHKARIAALLYHTDADSQLKKTIPAAKDNKQFHDRQTRKDDEHRRKQAQVHHPLAGLDRLLAQEWWGHLQRDLRSGMILELPERR